MACRVLSLSDSGTAACGVAADADTAAGPGNTGTIFLGCVVVAAERGSAHAASNAIVAKILTELAPLLADRAPAAAGSAACRWKFLSSALPFRKSRWRARPRKLAPSRIDRKSTRLNSSHSQISYAVFCLK